MQKLFIFLILFMSAGTLRSQVLNINSLKAVPAENFIIQITKSNIELPDFNNHDLIFTNYVSVGELLSQFTMPGNGKIISRFGWRSGSMHTGVDIKMAKGDTIYASFCGIVSRAVSYYGYGNMVVLEHVNNIETYYAHLSDFLVKNGDTIRYGQPIGLAGSTGRATTNHLHFEIRESGKPYDPELVFDFENSMIRESITSVMYLAGLNETKKSTAVVAAMEPVVQHYTVCKGDSLWEISKRYNTPIQTLCLLNNLNEQTILQIGQVIRLF